jgi:hypothetical protein
VRVCVSDRVEFCIELFARRVFRRQNDARRRRREHEQTNRTRGKECLQRGYRAQSNAKQAAQEERQHKDAAPQHSRSISKAKRSVSHRRERRGHPVALLRPQGSGRQPCRQQQHTSTQQARGSHRRGAVADTGSSSTAQQAAAAEQRQSSGRASARSPQEQHPHERCHCRSRLLEDLRSSAFTSLMFARKRMATAGGPRKE